MGYKPKGFNRHFPPAQALHASVPRRKKANTLQLKVVPVDDAGPSRRIVGEVHLRFDGAEAEPPNGCKRFARGASHSEFDAGTIHKADP